MAKFILISVLCAVFHCGSAFAALSSRSDVVYGADTITFDSISGLEWLDPILTLGYTLNGTPNFLCNPNPCLSLTNALQAGGVFEGFHVASADEVSQLWAHAGILDIDVNVDPNLHPTGQAIVSLAQLLGPAFRPVAAGNQWIIGINTSTPWPNGGAGEVIGRELIFSDVPFGSDPITTASTVTAQTLVKGDSTFAFGFWLVRPVTAVPLPAGLLLLPAASVVLLRRRRVQPAEVR